MNSVKMVLVIHEGVLGFVSGKETPHGAYIAWYIDGLRYERFLEKDEYVVKIEIIGEINA